MLKLTPAIAHLRWHTSNRLSHYSLLPADLHPSRVLIPSSAPRASCTHHDHGCQHFLTLALLLICLASNQCASGGIYGRFLTVVLLLLLLIIITTIQRQYLFSFCRFLCFMIITITTLTYRRGPPYNMFLALSRFRCVFFNLDHPLERD